MSDTGQFRSDLIAELRQELIGPDPCLGGEKEVLKEPPRLRYSAGILFPPYAPLTELEQSETDGSAPADDPTEDYEGPEEGQMPGNDPDYAGSEASPDAIYDETIALANSYFPSAIGLTFVCDASTQSLTVNVRAATYKSQKPAEGSGGTNEWHRKELLIEPILISLDTTARHQVIASIPCHEFLSLRAFCRSRSDGTRIVTVTLLNTKPYTPGEDRTSSNSSDCYYQTGFNVSGPDGSPVFQEYSFDSTATEMDQEENSLLLLFRNRKSFAIGHGCAPEWTQSGSNATSVRTEAMPAFRLPPIEPRSEGGDELSMYVLSGLDARVPESAIPDVLDALSTDYGTWISNREAEVDSLPEHLKAAAVEHLDKCNTALARIRAGIHLLRSNRNALEAFMRANQAILMQQLHFRRPLRGPEDKWEPLPDSYQPSDKYTGRWRTFQIAFILLNIPGIITADQNSEEHDRDLVDLIWFPTGGGKTEAYLGLSAFTIFFRRLTRPDNAGCTVLMRYTLRLLTAQQFQRASAMICACEQIRFESADRYGSERISIGLWVGQSLTPNSRADAVATLNKLSKRDSDSENKFQLLKCPWCGTALDSAKSLGYRIRSRPSPKTVVFVCPEERCQFSKLDHPLPVTVVDEDIYSNPPTMLIGTVDKFAMLAWRPESRSLFGLGTAFTPPELIIQDELHLISGPLGSMVGLYESVIDMMCCRNGHRPKIVASTATIRHADIQCRALYNRRTSQFPPPGLEISDSFFARENLTDPGRVYVGVLPTASPSFVTALVRTSAGLLQGAQSVNLGENPDESARDGYWTQIQYFNSLRELGRAATLVQADTPEYLQVIAKRKGIRRRNIIHFDELTSRKTAEEIPQILAQMEHTYPRADERSAFPIDVLLATNMISVGVDVDRLGLICMVGQPKTTSEYIQASSRVGRSRKAPGLVVTLYNPGKPRDRSHFERFREYHSALYRFVEPTSVTPFSVPVVQRALHALLVIAARVIGQIDNPANPDEAADVINDLAERLKSRVHEIDPEHESFVAGQLTELIDHWRATEPAIWGSFRPSKDKRPLMYPSGTSPLEDWDGAAWPTPSSMRNVDQDCDGAILPRYPSED